MTVTPSHTLTLEYVSTAKMAADVLTKAVSATQHNNIIKLLGMAGPLV